MAVRRSQRLWAELYHSPLPTFSRDIKLPTSQPRYRADSTIFCLYEHSQGKHDAVAILWSGRFGPTMRSCIQRCVAVLLPL